MLHLAWIAPLLLLIFYLASPRYRGEIAESRVRRILAAGLESRRYTILNDVVIPSGGGTIRIDHVVVSKFGIFVIESQYTRGWVSGTDVQDRWKQHSPGKTRRFENPVHRNRLQMDALAKLLDFPSQAFHRQVVLVGAKGFRNKKPLNVVEPEKLIPYIRARAEQRLDDEQAARALKGIEAGRIRQAAGLFASRSLMIRILLVLLLLAGLYLVFGDRLKQFAADWERDRARKVAPEDFNADGTPRTAQELWEDSLRCASSPDTGRCACYDPDGKRADLEPEKCRDLAERGSILRQ